MTIAESPYFISNKEWYYKLTNKAPPEKVKNYKEFYKLLNSCLPEFNLKKE